MSVVIANMSNLDKSLFDNIDLITVCNSDFKHHCRMLELLRKKENAVVTTIPTHAKTARPTLKTTGFPCMTMDLDLHGHL